MFKCQQCGLCCKGEANESFFGIRLFDFEAKRIKEKARELGIKADIAPSLTIADDNSKKELIIFYKFSHKDCPFLISKKCAIYEIRPIMCRAFPIITSGMKDGCVVRSKMCPEVERLKDEKTETLKDVAAVFGDCYLYCCLFESLVEERIKEIKEGIKQSKEKNKLPLADVSDALKLDNNGILEEIGKLEKTKELLGIKI